MSATSAFLYVKDGFTGGVGGATVNVTGSNRSLLLEGTQTGSNATINIGNNSGYAYLYNYDIAGPATVTLGANLTLNQVGTDVQLDTSTFGNSTSDLVNAGTIDAGFSGGTFNIQGGGGFTNQGTIDVSNGDTLSINAASWSNTGTISVTGRTLDIEATLSGAGSITLSAGATLTIGSATSGGPISLSSSNSVVNVNGSGDVVTITGNDNTVNVGGANDTLVLAGASEAVNISGGGASISL